MGAMDSVSPEEADEGQHARRHRARGPTNQRRLDGKRLRRGDTILDGDDRGFGLDNLCRIAGALDGNALGHGGGLDGTHEDGLS
jgi:hypothetical protein